MLTTQNPVNFEQLENAFALAHRLANNPDTPAAMRTHFGRIALNIWRAFDQVQPLPPSGPAEGRGENSGNETPLPGPPSRQKVLAYARRAVADEYANPYHGHFASYDNQAVLNAVLNHFNGAFLPTMGGAPLALDAERDEDLIRDCVGEAEQEFNTTHDIEL